MGPTRPDRPQESHPGPPARTGGAASRGARVRVRTLAVGPDRLQRADRPAEADAIVAIVRAAARLCGGDGIRRQVAGPRIGAAVVLVAGAAREARRPGGR